jgi:hypothetical protein
MSPAVTFLIVLIRPWGIGVWRTGIWPSGWDMPQAGVVFQDGLEPAEGFGL